MIPKILIAAFAIILLAGGWFFYVWNPPANEEEEIPEAREIPPEPTPTETIILHQVPFVSQAPLGNWSDPRQQNGCEEAAVLMALYWVDGRGLAPAEAEQIIIAASEYQRVEFGYFHDTSAQDTAERIFKGYFGYGNIEVASGITSADIIRQLRRGNLVIVPVNGQKLNNPFYTPPGPLQHQIVIIGYDPATQEFISHDPGTIHGAEFRYHRTTLDNALRDYPSGFHQPIAEINKVMITVRKR